jgi:hypothetical protein
MPESGGDEAESESCWVVELSDDNEDDERSEVEPPAPPE